ncbi:N-acetyl-gamma-glutamyl-phosphate reductase [Candidatus Gottesmanbacteria bacterium RBG_16_37_8]|uniref:N-acetyl-gamma-glutamyl-phosphate reductase n=1 Tax=Candidatus Gottesmanbacteria bacterium RBG_16_37_8 TaxID=1798371 RepID=A0A1F5YRF1_9BACT|nr:MAG: N-acetyl-gamma-glutamyl-phosphate reductase [Candidatus Gottesmanbacteria bacterium RBG_16_37_8]
MITVSVVGGSGYAGGELLRLLLQHPKVKIKEVTSRRYVGESVTLHHPNLRGQTDLYYKNIDKLSSCDVLFISLPNGVSMNYMDKFTKLAKYVIDLGADFRLNSESSWSKWYKTEHQKPDFLNKFVYGVPELHRNEIIKAKLVAGPGCEAIVTILSLFPVVKHKLINLDKIIIDAKMGSSQSGSKGTDSSHHPERSGVVRTYMPSGHRHTAEIEQELSFAGFNPKVSITATAIEMVRGLLVTIHTFLNKYIEEKDIWQAYRTEFAKEPFIRIVKMKSGFYRFPEPKILQGTNYCDIGFEIDKYTNRLVIIGAIDNLTKGTAGNAVQCMNLMCGYDEKLSLEFTGLHPI